MKNLETNLCDFVTKKVKERGYKMGQIPGLCFISRSSFYRYIRGLSPMPQDKKESLEQVLKLSAEEIVIFGKLVGLAAFDESLIRARKLLDAFFFGEYKPQQPHKTEEFAYYSGEKYLRTGQELFEVILKNIDSPDFSMTAKIINCMGQDILPQLSDFFARIALKQNVTIEHLVGFSDSDYEQNTAIIINLMMTLQTEKLFDYTVFLDDKTGSKKRMVFNDSMIIDAVVGKQHYYYWLSFAEGRSSALTFTDRFTYTFLSGNYNDFFAQYEPLKFEVFEVDAINNKMLELETPDHYLAAPNPCYNMIPPEVYRSVFIRCHTELRKALSKMLSIPITDEIMGGIRLALETRNAATYRHRHHTTVFSANGLRDFADTGRLSDHLIGFPPFNIAERRMVLQKLLDRNSDRKDPYRFYITENREFADRFGLIISDEFVTLSCGGDEYLTGRFKYISLKNDTASYIFSDYIVNQLIGENTMHKKAAVAFLKKLIDNLGTSGTELSFPPLKNEKSP